LIESVLNLFELRIVYDSLVVNGGRKLVAIGFALLVREKERKRDWLDWCWLELKGVSTIQGRWSGVVKLVLCFTEVKKKKKEELGRYFC